MTNLKNFMNLQFFVIFIFIFIARTVQLRVIIQGSPNANKYSIMHRAHPRLSI